MFRTLRGKIEARMGLKFVVALTGVVSALMVIGTAFVSRMLMESQYRNIETRGRELGFFLGKASTDHILVKDIIAVDSLISEAVKSSEDMLYTAILDPSGTASMSTALASFNTGDPDMQALLADEKTDDVMRLISKAGERLDPIEVTVDINLEKTKMGTVKMGFSRAGVRKGIIKVAGLLILTSAAIVALLSVLVYFMVRKMIVVPTKEAVDVASNISAGDLTRSVRVKSIDELGMLGRGLNRMIVGLNEIIGSVRGAALNLGTVSREINTTSKKITEGGKVQAEAVEEAASSVNEMHFSLKEIAASAEDLNATTERTSSSVLEMTASVSEVAKTMTDLSGSIEDTTTAINEMTATIRQVAENVEMLSAAAEQTAASASEINASLKEVEAVSKQSAVVAEAVAADAQGIGMRSIEKTIEGMGRINESARRASDVVNRLGERAENIGSILTVIEDITDQTALLALNAAILAAQAGEHGKGFAVVAAEIRELANRTASSTQEITGLIASVQEEARQAVEAMRLGIESVEEGVNLSRDAGEALRNILDRAGQSRDMSRAISKAAEEQTRGVRQVSEAVDKINEMAHQIAFATNEQKTGSEQIIKAAEKMREITRFVASATAEQAKGGKDVSKAVETMNAKAGMMRRAAGEVRTGSDLIVKAIERIKLIVKNNADLADGLYKAVDALSIQSESLKKEIERFRTSA